MTNNLVPAYGGLEPRPTRSLARALKGLDQSTTFGLAKIESQAQMEAGRAHAVGYVGQQAMQAIAMVSEMEGQLGRACPPAANRLRGIADVTALGMAQVVADSVCRIGR